jgi:transcriptional regulator with XRE-family HTH domain
VLPHRLRQIREDRGYSQRELGRLCNLGANQINRYENGITDPTIHTLKSIADQLEVSTDYLLGVSDDPLVQVREPALSRDERAIIEVYRHEGWSGVARLSVERLSK